MRAPGEDARRHPARGRARLLGPGDQPDGVHSACARWRPRHVRDLRGGPPAARESPVGRDATGVHDHLHGGAREARLDVLVHQGVGHAVVVVIHLHVVINVDDTGFPFRQLVARGGQRAERRSIELLEQRAPANAEDLHQAAIDHVDPLANRGIERGEIEKGSMPQGGEDPPFGDLYTDFDFGFVFGRLAARRNHHGAVVLREFGRTSG